MTTYLVGVDFHSRTTSTGQWAWRTTESETLPIRALLIPPRPLLPITTSPASISSARWTISLAASPSSDAPVRPFHLPTVLVPPPRRAFPCLAALRAVRYPPPGSGQVALLPRGRSLPGKA